MPKQVVVEASGEREARRDSYFRGIVRSHLIDTFRDALEESDFGPDEVDELTIALAALPEPEAYSVLALPAEIRNKLLTKYHEKVATHEMEPAAMIQDLLEKNRKYHYTLGFHLSPRKIPKIQTEGGTFEWNIKGDELDDRDDMKMAYYSEDYLHRYKKKRGEYLYVVRAETGPNSSHRQDLRNHWGRAPYLSIIDELPMNEVEQQIDTAIEKENAAA